MNSSYNYVDNVIAGNLLGDNARATASGLTGTYNRVAFLGEYAFTTIALKTNRPFSLSNVIFSDTVGSQYTVANGKLTVIDKRFNVVVKPDPQPQLATVAFVASNATMALTATLDRGTSNVVLYCTEMGGSENPVTNIVIPLDAPDKVTTNITVDAPGQKGFWRIKSIR